MGLRSFATPANRRIEANFGVERSQFRAPEQSQFGAPERSQFGAPERSQFGAGAASRSGLRSGRCLDGGSMPPGWVEEPRLDESEEGPANSDGRDRDQRDHQTDPDGASSRTRRTLLLLHIDKGSMPPGGLRNLDSTSPKKAQPNPMAAIETSGITTQNRMVRLRGLDAPYFLRNLDSTSPKKAQPTPTAAIETSGITRQHHMRPGSCVFEDSTHPTS